MQSRAIVAGADALDIAPIYCINPIMYTLIQSSAVLLSMRVMKSTAM